MTGAVSLMTSAGGKPFSVLVTPSVFGSNTTPPVYTDYASATVVGGVGPFTYAWSLTYGDVTIQTPNQSYTRFYASPPPGEPKTAVAYCTVTDTATGAVVIGGDTEIWIERL